jgi:uncharacterized repeat protein (TIGR01451 family)
LPFGASRAYAQGSPSSKTIWLKDPQALSVTFDSPAIGAPTRVMQSFATGQVQPLTLANGRFYEEDGIEGLAVGYATSSGGAVAIYRGNLDAFAPQSEESFLAIGQGRFPAPFLPNARLFELPQRPDFIAAGDFTGGDHVDVVAATKGSSALYILANDAHGNFTAYPAFTLPGVVTALATAKFNNQISEDIIVAVDRPAGPALLVYSTSAHGLYLIGAYPLQAPATALAVGNLDGDAVPDVAVIAGGNLSILHGRNLTAAGNPAQGPEAVPLPFSSTAIALGSFIFDRDNRSQIALLASDGSLNIVVRNGFDPTPWTLDEIRARRQRLRSGEPDPYVEQQKTYRPDTWRVIENMPAVASSGNSGVAPVLMKSHITNDGADDLTVLDSVTGQLNVIAHAFRSIEDNSLPPGAFPPAVRLNRAYTGTSLVAAMPMRVNVDGRPGIISLHAGQMAPSAMMPTPDPTFFPNRFDDIAPRGTGVTCLNTTGVDGSGDCTLREAVIKANGDNISLQAGTYTLSIAKVVNDCTGNFGALSAGRSMTIVGAGQNTTFIQAGTVGFTPGPANGVDMVMNVNEDLGTANCPITNSTVSISNLTMQNGHNRGTVGNFDGDGGCMEFDTGSSGTANLTLTNVTLQNCDTTDGNGAGLAIFNATLAGNGLATISNSIFQGNKAIQTTGGATGTAGGVWVSDPARMSMSSSQVLNNLAPNTDGINHAGSGGGITITSNSTGSRQTVIHASTISGNHAAGLGGGLNITANTLIDQSSVISNNLGGTANVANLQNGGGIWMNTGNPDLVTLTKISITGNSAANGNGGGISDGSPGGTHGTLNVSFSRLAGNTALAGSNLNNIDGTVTATNNWWGTNAPAATINNVTTTATFDPFIVLGHSATPAIIKINQSTTMTGDMSKDNHGNGAALAGNLNQIVGLPITFDSPVLGTIPDAQPETLGNPVPTATATFNAGAVSGRGSAHATVDQAVVSVNSNLIATATEAANTVTITTVGAHNFAAGETVVISGVGVAGYNGTFAILATPTATTFTYSDPTAGLAASSGGTANVGIIILEPLTITKSFVPATVAVNAPSALTFSVNNPNVIAVDANFTDTLPVNLVVANPPAATNTCGGIFAPAAGAASVTFTNALLPVGTCTITVHVASAVDNVYNNTVTINSTAAGTGGLSTSSANLTVINPPQIAKAFGVASIPLNGTTSLTITVSNTNVNTTLNGITFTDNLPAGLVVATPSNLNDTCSGAATAVAGSSSVSLAASTLAPGASCAVSLNVTGTTSGTKNNSVAATATTAGTGNTSTASLEVVGPPVIIKAFGAASIPLNGSTSLTFTIQNNNTITTLTGIGFTDTLPAGLVISTPNGLTGSCGGGTITATQATSLISLSGASLTASTSCTFSINVTGTAAGSQNNTTGNVTSTEGGTGGTASASVAVVAPPSIAKVFNPNVIALNATTSLQFTITNPGANTVALTGVAFTDTLPTGLTVANSTSTVCGGTLTTTAPTGISLTGATIAVNSQCQFSVTVTGATAGQYTNTTGNVTSTNGGTGNTATANLTVASPPSIAKAFGAASIPLNGTTSLTFTINNPNTSVALTGLAFTDNLPTGLVVATPNGLTNTCGGTVTAVAGSGSVSLSGGTLATSASCTVSVNVQGTTAGVKNNSVQVTSTEGGTGNTSNASITVVAPPGISKAFGAASIPLNGSTSLSFTIQNSNTTTTLTGVAFSDILPAGLIISTPNGQTGSCGGGTITATQGTSVISLSGATLAASTSCTFSINVTGTAAGSQNNTTGNVTSTEGGTGNTASANVTVVAPPSIAKVFNPNTIALNATTALQFTITNPGANTVALTGVGFTDALPTGLTVASSTSTVCGGTLMTTPPTNMAFVGATIAVNSQCQFSVTVTGAAAGQYTNTTGNVNSTNGGTGNTATANLTVANPPAITKLFGAAQMGVGNTTSLTFTITNPNTSIALTGVAFTDNLPAGLVVATPNGLTNNCGGAATAVAGSGSVSLSAGTLAVSTSCTVAVNIQATTGGVKNNTVQVTSTEGGTGNTSNASITIVGPPTLTKAFGAASVALNGTTTLTFTVTNPNTSNTLSGVAFTDNLPAGLIISTPNGQTGSCGAGTITATQGTNLISLSGGTLAANGSCTFAVNVTGTAAGAKNNTTGAITSTEGGTGTTSNTATLQVVAPPSIAKAFNPTGIPLNGTSTLTITITNPAANAVQENGVAFNDNFPANLFVATPNGLTNTCGGTATATAGSGSVSLSGGTIAANSSCVVSVNVTSSVGGVYTNSTGNVSSTNGGTGNTASANLSVAAAPTITKSFLGVNAVKLNGTVFVNFDLTNPNASVDLHGIAFTDNLPAGLVVATPNGAVNGCGGTLTATPGSSTITFTGGVLPAANPTCSVGVVLLATSLGVKNNITGPISSNESGPGATSNTDTLEVIGPPTVSKIFGTAAIPVGGTTSLTFTFTNAATTVTLVNVTLADTFPAGLVVANPNGVGGTCVTVNGAAVTANPGANGVSITAFNMPPNSNCTFSVNVTGISAGVKNNTSGNVMATYDDGTGTFIGINGGTASASVTVVAPPAIAKVFNPAVIPLNATTALTFTITNPNPVALTGVGFTDTLPAGLTVPNASATVCGGTVILTAPAGISMTNATINGGAQCIFSVTVTGAAAGNYTNVTSAVTSTNGGTGNTATANLSVTAADLTITKSHVGTFFQGQVGATYTVTVSNVGTTPSAGTVTVTDTLPASLTATAMTGTGWTCTVATLTCTRSDALANGASYPPITLTVNVAANAPASVTNTATVANTGDVNPANNTANDLTTITTVSLTITPGVNSATVKRGQTATFTFTVNANVPGTIALLCSGLPQGTNCSFNPLTPSSNGSTPETMLVTTTAPPGLVMNQPQVPLSREPVYVAMAMTLPTFGLLFVGIRRNRRKAWFLVLAVLVLIAIFGLAGCGGHPRDEGGDNGHPTPPGTYTITVTATNGNVSAQTTVTLTVTP